MNMIRRNVAWVFAAAAVASFLPTAVLADDLAAGFASPPPSARPWVYLFALDGNLSRDGITADLEAMVRTGIGGVLYMETDQGAPKGPARFGDPAWRALFSHMIAEAERLGLQVNMNNDAGWTGSGGPWITPELSMQTLVWAETNVAGLARFDGILPAPQSKHDYYRDIAVYAYPTPAVAVELPQLAVKTLVSYANIPLRADYPDAPAGSAIRREDLVDLTARMGEAGRLTWDVPEGRWTILRMGHTTTGKDNHPAPLEGRGLECDKLSREAAEVHFNALMGSLIDENRSRVGETKTWVSTHIDSWEVGTQNWTPKFQEEFLRRRGYDPLPFLPVVSGKIIDRLELSERFLWDLRQTVGELMCDHYAGHMRDLAHRHGIRLSIEAYDKEPGCSLTYAGRADEPMGEFWSWRHTPGEGIMFAFSCTEMASAAHVYGRPIVGAEAFTASRDEKWQSHPATIKAMGDWAFCEGINRFVFHRYAHQPWTNPDRAPGMSMGPWGLHYERTQTWWEMSKAWHEYLARCQFLLQQGLFVADLCFLAPERSPHRLSSPVKDGDDRRGYNYDACPPEALLTRMSVRDGRLVLPDGMSYRMLVLPRVKTMTPGLLGRVAELVEAGATVLGAPPVKAPGLTDYPRCDKAVRELVRKLWGDAPAPTGSAGRPVGLGRVIWPEALTLPVDSPYEFNPLLSIARWIWTPEGRPERAAPPGTRYFRRMVTIEDPDDVESARIVMTADNSFTCWVNGERAGRGERFQYGYPMDIRALLRKGENLIAAEAVNTLDTPNPAGFVGVIRIRARDGRETVVTTDGSWQAAASAPDGWQADASLSHDWSPAMDLGPMGMKPWGAIAEGAEEFDDIPDIDIAIRVLAAMGVPPDFESTPYLRHIHKRIGDTDVYFVANPANREVVAECAFRVEGKIPEIWNPETGGMERAAAYSMNGGRTALPLRLDPAGSVFVVFRHAAPSDAPAAGGPNWREFGPGVDIPGPWTVDFLPSLGGPERVVFQSLEDWSGHTDAGIRYYSGPATYAVEFEADASLAGAAGVTLDLGRVEVMADVKLNGKDLGIAWKPPYRLDATGALRPGTNRLEIKVVNLWINRMIGDEHLPEDSDRNPNGTLTAWPSWLEQGNPSPTGRFTFTSWRLWTKDDPLVPSGLLGPVRLLRPTR